MAILYRHLFCQGVGQIVRIDLNNSWLETHLLIDSANQRILLNEKVRVGRRDDEMRTLGLRLASQRELAVIFETLVNNLPMVFSPTKWKCT